MKKHKRSRDDEILIAQLQRMNQHLSIALGTEKRARVDEQKKLQEDITRLRNVALTNYIQSIADVNRGLANMMGEAGHILVPSMR